MAEKRQKIPLLLRIKRLKNSAGAERINSLLSLLKPARKFRGKPKTILLVRNDKIGDAVVTLPVIRDIKLNHPEITIEVLASSGNKFVFNDFEYADEIIEFDWAPPGSGRLYTLPLLGGIMQFIRYAAIAFLFSPSFRKQIRYLRSKKYDAAVDLVGLLRNAMLCRIVSSFIVGPRKFLTHVLYSYYIETNWVTAGDLDFMTRKIEKTITDSLGLALPDKNLSLPLLKTYELKNSENSYDLVYHLGAAKLRKLTPEKEEEIIRLMSGKKLLVTDSYETQNWNVQKTNFGNNGNIRFKIFESMRDAATVCSNSRLLLCYDGGQAHYLSQFIRTVVIFGPGSASLWRPYEFSGYTLLEEGPGGVKAFKSGGKFGHISIYRTIWCSPCFDVGCKERPCLSGIKSEFIWYIIDKYCPGR